jgi:hypothetical protein
MRLLRETVIVIANTEEKQCFDRGVASAIDC